MIKSINEIKSGDNLSLAFGDAKGWHQMKLRVDLVLADDNRVLARNRQLLGGQVKINQEPKWWSFKEGFMWMDGQESTKYGAYHEPHFVSPCYIGTP